MLILQKNIFVFSYKSCLFFVNDFGISILQTFNFLNKLYIYCTKEFFDIKVIHNDYKSIIIKDEFLFNIKKILSEFSFMSKQKLLLFGIGFRGWIFKNSIIVKLGFSNDIVLVIPNYIKVLCLKSFLFFITGCSKIKLYNFVASLRKLRIPDVYKGKGVLYIDQKVHLKQGKHN